MQFFFKGTDKGFGLQTPVLPPISATWIFAADQQLFRPSYTQVDRFQSLKLWPVLVLIRREQWETEKPK